MQQRAPERLIESPKRDRAHPAAPRRIVQAAVDVRTAHLADLRAACVAQHEARLRVAPSERRDLGKALRELERQAVDLERAVERQIRRRRPPEPGYARDALGEKGF